MIELWKADLHIHTYCSRDSFNSPEKIIKYAHKKGLNVIGITDHNTVKCLPLIMEMGEKNGIKVIPGIEVKTREGELIAYYPEGIIKKGYSLIDTVKMIRDARGIIAVPHPLDRLRRSAVGRSGLDKIIGDVDIVEVWNARTTFIQDNSKALMYARKHKKHISAGSDAHFPYEIGRAYIAIPPFNGKEDFLYVLSQGTVSFGQSPLWVHIPSTLAKGVNLFKRRKFHGRLC